MFRIIFLLLIGIIKSLNCQTVKTNLNPEIETGFQIRKVHPKYNIEFGSCQLFAIKNEDHLSGILENGSTSSPLVYSKLFFNSTREINDHWNFKTQLHTQLGRYYFYNINRAYTTIGTSLAHRGYIDDLTFDKEIGISINNQSPRSIKDIFFISKISYFIKNKGSQIAIASLIGKIDWLGTSFDNNQNDIFAIRAKDESFIKRIDQSMLSAQLEWFITRQISHSIKITYFTEYFPLAQLGYDKQNIKHYILSMNIKYNLIKNKGNLILTDVY